MSHSEETDAQIRKLKDVFDSYVSIEKRYKTPKNIFSILNYKRNPNTTSKEMSYQYALKYFLNPTEPHGFGSMVLESFLDLISEKQEKDSSFSIDHIKIDSEVAVKEEDTENSAKRVDLLIANYKDAYDFDQQPDWVMLIELKVGASENENQTKNYFDAENCYPDWTSDALCIKDEEQSCFYIYVKKQGRKKAEADKTKGNEDFHKFDSIDWAEMVNKFENDLSTRMLGLPHRSVVQFSDFIDSLKGEEQMSNSSEEEEKKETNEILKLYLENKNLLDKNLPNLKGKIDGTKENFINRIQENWAKEIGYFFGIPEYDGDSEGSEWCVNPGEKWGRIQPKYWIQEVGKNTPVNVSFLHLIDRDVFKETGEICLKFGFRLPPQRGAHTKKVNGTSFNKIFREEADGRIQKHYPDDEDKIQNSFGGAGQIFVKEYPLKEKCLFDSYMEKLKEACGEFCCNKDLVSELNEIFRETFEQVYGEPPQGEFPGELKKQNDIK